MDSRSVAMIEDPPVLKLRRNFERPPAQLVAALADVPTGYVVDCMDGHGALDYRVKSLLPDNSKFTGVAVTCDCGPADNLGVLGAMDIAQPGDVIVATTQGFCATAVIGDLLLAMMKNAGLTAFVTDGLARDLEGVEEVGFPIFCKGITPNSPARNGPATAGYPINVDSVYVCPGDVIVADRDGVVVVPQTKLQQVVDRLDTVKALEARAMAQIDEGVTMPGFYTEFVNAGKVEEDR